MEDKEKWKDVGTTKRGKSVRVGGRKVQPDLSGW